MKWKLPSETKIYEALGSVADGRVEVSGSTAKVYSSSRNKFYEVTFDPIQTAIMSNDNSSYWTGELGYPSIAFLMKIGVLNYNQTLGDLLKGVAWKDINQKFKNDFEKALDYILSSKTEDEREDLANFVDEVYRDIEKLNLCLLGKKVLLPKGY